MQSLVESQISSQDVYVGQILRVCSDIVRLPNGVTTTRELVVHPGAVMIVPVLYDESGNIKFLLERQFRYPVGKVMVEFPAGKLDPGETCIECAVRELREETGYTAQQWAHVASFNPLVAYSTEAIDIWFARQLVKGQSHPDAEEFIEPFVVTGEDFFEMCRSGKVSDGKSLVAAFWLMDWLSGRLDVSWCAVDM